MSLSLRTSALVAMLAVLVVTTSVRAEPPADPPDPAAEQETPKKPHVLVTISEETTRITEPLREDGYVDYVAALNELSGRDVTPENNAAVLFWQAVGPAEMIERHPGLTAEVSFRAHDIAPGGEIDPAWRDLFVRHSDRFMIGTDTYINDRWDAYGSLIEEHRNWLGQLPRAAAEAIAHGNATRVFGENSTPSQ